MDIPVIASVISALGVGSFVGQYLIGAHQRRQLRSEVLRNLARVESARWAGHGEPSRAEFQEGLRDLEAAALVARLPRGAVVQYKVFAQAARWLSDSDVENDPMNEYAGGINGAFADLVHEHAADISRLVWKPWIGRFGLKRRLRTRRERAEAIDNNEVQHDFKRALERG